MSAETLYKLCINGKASADYILLGRQPDSDIKTPGMELLCKIPPQYSQIVEDMLRALFNAIKLAETKMEE